MMILICTAYKRSGLLYERFKENFGKDDDSTLVVKGTTREFNNLFPQAEIDKDLRPDPAKFASEYLPEWRDDLSAFIDRALVEAATTLACRPSTTARRPLRDLHRRQWRQRRQLHLRHRSWRRATGGAGLPD